MIDYDLTSLLMVFDELDPLTNEEQKFYWLNFYRPDKIKILLSFSEWDGNGDVVAEYDSKSNFSCSFKRCFSIKVLNEKKKCLEVLCGEKESPTLRIFISLIGDNILEVENF